MRTTTESNKPPAASGDRTYGRLAKRISAWTTNGLLTVVILLAGVVFGRQVLRWWAVESPPLAASPRPENDPLGDPTQLHVLEFGDQPWSMSRRTVAGDKKAVQAALRAQCCDLLRQATMGQVSKLPEAAAQASSLLSAGKLKTRPTTIPVALAADLARRHPVDEDPGKWRLYAIDEELPIFLGISSEKRNTQTDPGQRLAKDDSAVVIWGLGAPGAQGTWTLYTFQRAATAPLVNGTDIPPPPGGSRILSARVAGGASFTAFTGPKAPEDWKRSFDGWFNEHGWSASDPWRRTGSGWHARFARRDQDIALTADVQFGDDERGRARGLVFVAPAGM